MHAAAMPHDRLASLCLAIGVSLFATGGALVMLNVPFPTGYDELQHLSFIAALREAPTLFPHYGAYRALSADLQGWTPAMNYIAHPPLYYLLLAPFGNNVVLLRGLNLAMATTGFGLCATAGVRLLATTAQRVAFLAALLLFSKPALIAGMINNDNLVLLETGVLMWLITSDRARPVALALTLAAVGWTKFNAFVGLVFLVGILHLREITVRQAALFGQRSTILLVGIVAGTIPTIANLLILGTAAYVATDFLYVAPSARPSYDLVAFMSAFAHKIGQKIFFADGVVDLLPIVGGMTLLAACSSLARPARARDVAASAVVAMSAFAVLHVCYGWNSFRMLGSMSDAQSRYYVMLWPGFALAAVVGATALVERLTAGRVKTEPAEASA